jgi:hypothetical protein
MSGIHYTHSYLTHNNQTIFVKDKRSSLFVGDDDTKVL